MALPCNGAKAGTTGLLLGNTQYLTDLLKRPACLLSLQLTAITQIAPTELIHGVATKMDSWQTCFISKEIHRAQFKAGTTGLLTDIDAIANPIGGREALQQPT